MKSYVLEIYIEAESQEAADEALNKLYYGADEVLGNEVEVLGASIKEDK